MTFGDSNFTNFPLFYLHKRKAPLDARPNAGASLVSPKGRYTGCSLYVHRTHFHVWGQRGLMFLPRDASHYASSYAAGYGPLSVRHTPVLYRNGCMDPIAFRPTGFPRSSYTEVWGNCGIPRSEGTSFWNFFSNSGLSKSGRSSSTVTECDQQATVVGRLLITW